jgi:hypothetical protein
MALDPGDAADGPPERGLVAALSAAGVFAILSVWAAVVSEGFLEADSCTHYLYARFALAEPHYLVNVWGRPLCTGIYAIPAALAGRMGVRLMSLVLALTCAGVAMHLARLQGYRRPVLALIFTLAQPLLFLHSFSELTELPFATLIVLAFWAYHARQFWLMALLIGISPLGRPEGFGFLGLAGLALLMQRRWYWLWLLVLPMVLWNHAGWVLYGKPGPWWRWLPDNWPYAQDSLYLSGYLLHFVALLPLIVGPLAFPATLLGAWRSSSGVGAFLTDHRARCRVLIAVLPALILVGHSLLYWLGKMASNGEARYMLIVAPFWGLLSAAGWEWVFDRLRWRRAVLWAGLAAAFPVMLNSRLHIGPLPVGFKVIPLVLSEDWHRAREVAEWYRTAEIRDRYPLIMASHPGVFYALDQSPTARDATVEWRESSLTQAPPETLLIWDSIYGLYNSDVARSISEDEIAQAGWVELRTFPTSGNIRWRVYTRPGPPASQPSLTSPR